MRPRSRLLAALAALAVVTALGAVAYLDTTRPVERVHTEQVRGISRELRILHLADLHAMRFGPGQRDIERELGGQQFDAIVITGDLLAYRAGDRTPARELVDVLKKHSDAILFVRGNHDSPDLAGDLAARGVTVLEKGSVVRLGSGATRTTVVYADPTGLIDTSVSVETTLLVIAMHQPPDAATLAAARRLTRGTQVFLAGHTHGGQIRIPGIGAVRAPVRWQFGPIIGGAADEWFPEWRGIPVMGVYRRGDQIVEITPGLGTVSVPVRLFDPAELTVLRLVPQRSPAITSPRDAPLVP